MCNLSNSMSVRKRRKRNGSNSYFLPFRSCSCQQDADAETATKNATSDNSYQCSPEASETGCCPVVVANRILVALKGKFENKPLITLVYRVLTRLEDV